MAAARDVCNMTIPLGDVSCLFLWQRVQGSGSAIIAFQIIRAFQADARVVADVGNPSGMFTPNSSSTGTGCFRIKMSSRLRRFLI